MTQTAVDLLEYKYKLLKCGEPCALHFLVPTLINPFYSIFFN